MPRSIRRLLLVPILVSLAFGTMPGAVVGDHGTDPNLTATPNDDLPDDEPVTITIAGTGYEPDAAVQIQQCRDEPGQGHCLGIADTTVDSGGGFSEEVEVDYRFLDDSTEPDKRCDWSDTESCYMTAVYTSGTAPGTAPDTAEIVFEGHDSRTDPVVVSIDDVSAPEGDEGTSDFTFTISLAEEPTESVTVDYQTQDQTAEAADDYVETIGSVVFEPDETSETVSVPVIGDTEVEDDEVFTIALSSEDPNVTFEDGLGEGTIENDDAPLPFVYIDNVSEFEGDSGDTPFTFTISLTDPSEDQVSVDWDTSDGTAVGSDSSVVYDYESASGTVTFEPGDTEEQVVIDVVGETAIESDEDFTVTLSNPENATIPTEGEISGVGTGTILNDDEESTEPPAPSEDTTTGFASGEEESTFQTSDDDPVQFSVLTVPEGFQGAVVMQEVQETVCPLPPRIACIGERLDLEAPDTTAQEPLVLVIWVSASELPRRSKPKDVVVYHTNDEGVTSQIPSCRKKPKGVANPAPTCLAKVATKREHGQQFLRITIYTAENGSWRPSARLR